MSDIHPKRRQWVKPLAAATALLLSIGLHIVLITTLPAVPVGRPPVDAADFQDYTTTIADVYRERMHQLARRPVYTPRSPGDIYPLEQELQAFENMYADTLDSLEWTEADVPLQGEQSATAPAPETAPAETGSELRQQVVAITERSIADELSALPRRLTPDIPRVPVAPRDITMPESWDLPLERASQLSTDDGPAMVITGPEKMGGASGAGTAHTRPPEVMPASVSDVLDESREDITDAQPMEQHLAVGFRVFRSRNSTDAFNYFELQVSRASATSLPVLPRDILLLQDCSESMTQRKLDDCKNGLEHWLATLNQGDRFNIVSFREETESCFDTWAEVNVQHQAKARWFISEMQARGRTDVFSSLEALSSMAHDNRRPLIAVLVTDGRPTQGLVDSSDIIEAFTTLNDGRVSVFSVGGGKRANRYLLDLLSYRNRGDSMVVEEHEKIPAALKRWAAELKRPVLMDLSYRFASHSAVEVYPERVTHLYLDRPLTLIGRVPPGQQELIFQITGRSAAGHRDMVFTMDLADGVDTDSSLRQAWVWHKIYALIGEHIETRDDRIMDEIRSLAARYSLHVPYSSEFPTRY